MHNIMKIIHYSPYKQREWGYGLIPRDTSFLGDQRRNVEQGGIIVTIFS